MISGYFRTAQIRALVIGLTVLGTLVLSQGQSDGTAGKPGGSVWGYVRDNNGKPLANVSVSLQSSTSEQPPTAQTLRTQTDSNGLYRFQTLQAGIYSLHAQADGYAESNTGPVNLSGKDTKRIDLSLTATGAPSAKQKALAPEFFDEPQFTSQV